MATERQISTLTRSVSRSTVRHKERMYSMLNDARPFVKGNDRSENRTMASGGFGSGVPDGGVPDGGLPDGAGIGTEQSPQKLVAVALKRERTRAGLSLSEVARRADIAKSTLSQLESGLGNPSLETLWALGNALGVPFSQLVDSQAQTVQLIRAGEGPAIASANASYIATLLAPSPPNARRDLYRIVAEPGEPRISTPHARGTTEHVVIGTGRAEVGPTADPIELGPGDYLAYPGDEEHIFRALEPGTTAILVSEHT